ncbi:hypothetical protein V8G54_006582 [Vigna mungo]|uniref:Uncharacterized protein n=1 Tax=Vigna mungo TaxID=3915 RepID=A0AAQ3P087_VIGMU
MHDLHLPFSQFVTIFYDNLYVIKIHQPKSSTNEQSINAKLGTMNIYVKLEESSQNTKKFWFITVFCFSIFCFQFPLLFSVSITPNIQCTKSFLGFFSMLSFFLAP